jgi:hypothetical protein
MIGMFGKEENGGGFADVLLEYSRVGYKRGV